MPYDAHSAYLFDGEETSLAVRAWTMATILPSRQRHASRTSISRTSRRCARVLDPGLGAAGAGPVLDHAPHQLVVGAARPVGLLGERDAARHARRHGLRPARAAAPWTTGQQTWGVTPDRDGVEWSPGRCKVETGRRACPRPRRRAAAQNTTREYAGHLPGKHEPRRLWTPTTPAAGPVFCVKVQHSTRRRTMPRSASQAGSRFCAPVRSISARDWSAILCVQINH